MVRRKFWSKAEASGFRFWLLRLRVRFWGRARRHTGDICLLA